LLDLLEDPSCFACREDLLPRPYCNRCMLFFGVVFGVE